MTIRDIFISLGFNLDKVSQNEAEQGINKLKNMAVKALGAIGIGFSVSGLFTAIQSCVSLSSAVEEMQNKFDVVFQGMTDEVEAWAKSYADAIGRNSNDIKTYLADQQNLLVGFGMTRKEGAELSKQMTTLALDLASFANLDEASAVNNMTKAVMGESEAAKALGAVLNDYTREQAMLSMGLTGTYDKLDQLTKMQVNYQAILAQSPDAIGDCERSLGSYESTLKSFHSKLKELKTVIGQFFMPTFQKVISFGARGVTMLREAAQKISDFAAKVGGAEKILAVLGVTIGATLAILNFRKIADGIKLIGKSLGSVNLKIFAIAAVVLLLVLLIEDFLAFMRGDNSLIGSIFEKAGIDADKARETILGAWNAVKGFLLGVWNFLKSKGQEIFGALSSWWSQNGEGVKSSFLSIWNSIKTLCSALWTSLSNSAKIIFEGLKLFWGQWGSTIISVFSSIWNTLVSLIQPLLSAFAAIIDFLANVFTGNWAGAWNAVKDLAAAVWDMIIIVISNAWNILCSVWSRLGEILGGFFQAAWNVITEKVSGIKDSIVNGFQAAIDWLKSLPEQAIQWGADIIQGIVNGITGAVGKIGEAVGGVANKIKSFLGFSVPEAGPLSDFDTYMPDMIDLMTEGINKGKSKVVSALGLLTDGMSVAAQANIVSPDTLSKAGSSSSVSKSVVQNVSISNNFNGDRAGQEKSAEAMEKASDDATGEMARAIAFTR